MTSSSWEVGGHLLVTYFYLCYQSTERVRHFLRVSPSGELVEAGRWTVDQVEYERPVPTDSWGRGLYSLAGLAGGAGGGEEGVTLVDESGTLVLGSHSEYLWTQRIRAGVVLPPRRVAVGDSVLAGRWTAAGAAFLVRDDSASWRASAGVGGDSGVYLLRVDDAGMKVGAETPIPAVGEAGVLASSIGRPTSLSVHSVSGREVQTTRIVCAAR